MPYPHEHSARIVEPSKFIQDSFRRENDKFGDGIDPIFGRLKNPPEGEAGSMVLHTIRFRSDKWTVAQAKKWLKDHDYHPLSFEPAEDSKGASEDMPIFKYITFKTSSVDDMPPLPMQIAEAVNPERVIRFRASDDTLDRCSEVILPDGWMLDEWAKNPVIMQFHDYSMWPLGKGIAAGIVDNALMIDAEIDPPEVDESADMVFRKIKHGTIKSGSVGFEPIQWVMPGSKSGDDLFVKYPGAKRIFVKQSLLEFTICPIPANPNALAASMAKMYAKNLGLEAGQESATPASLSGISEDVALKIAQIKLNSMK